MNDHDDPRNERRQLFPRWSNVFTRWLFAATFFTVVGLVTVAYCGYRSDWWQHQEVAPDQPVLFSHHHHASELRIDCRYCHGSVETSSFAGMPATETCMSCHSGVFTDTSMLAPVLTSARANIPLEWTRVYDLPDYVYFNHSAHVTHGIGCTSCHGDIGNQRLTRKAQPLFMTWCLDCHREPEKFVRNSSEIFSPAAPARSDLPLENRLSLVRRYGIVDQPLTDCITCHR